MVMSAALVGAAALQSGVPVFLYSVTDLGECVVVMRREICTGMDQRMWRSSTLPGP